MSKIDIDLDADTLQIQSDKLADIYNECKWVANKRTLTIKKYKSLLGKLLYFQKCVKPARTFIKRNLALFRSNHDKKTSCLNKDFHKDIQWFLLFC